MNGLTFAQPVWLWGCLLILPLVVLRLRSHFHSRRRLTGLVSPRLAHRLVNGASQARRWATFLTQALALAFLFLGLARPQLGVEEIETEIEARGLLLAIDTSRSMLSDDLAPNRITRAKLAAKDIVLSLPDDRIGLIAFAGKPFLQAPLTNDHEAVLEAIDQLDTEIIPRGGTNLSAAVNLALDTVEEMKSGPVALVLFSDGEALEGAEELERVRERAAKAGLSIVAVGVGTTQGSIIPETDEEGNTVPGAFVRDEQGQVVRTRLDPVALQALVAERGSYLHLGGAASLTQVVDQVRKGIATSREESETTRRPIERFVWPLSAAAILLALSHLLPLLWLKPTRALRPEPTRRGSLAPLAAAALLSPLGALAAEEPTDGAEALARGDYEEAIATYEAAVGERHSARERGRIRSGIGAAAFRLGDFERAAESYGAVLAEGAKNQRSTAHYNLGNTLFRRGETILRPGESQKADPDQVQAANGRGEAIDRARADWEAAVEHFESSLALDRENPHAAHNLAYVKKRLEELKEEEQQQQDQEQKQDEEKKEEEQKEEEKDKKEEEKKDEGEEDKQEGEEDKQEGEPEKEQGDPPSDQGDPSEEGNDKEEQSKEQPPSEKDAEEGKEKDGETDPEGEEDQQSPPSSPPGETPPQPDAPQDGELGTNPNQTQPQEAPPSPADPADAKPNPMTGYSPSEARQLLDALADETEVRPLLPQSKGEKFKNW